MCKDILFRSHSCINKKNCLSRLKIMFVVRYLYCQICQCILTFADIIVFTSLGREQRLLVEEGWEQKIKEEDTNAIWKKPRIISYFTDLYPATENTVFFSKNNKKMLCQFDLNKFWNERVGPRKQAASSKLRDTMAILTELLRVLYGPDRPTRTSLSTKL